MYGLCLLGNPDNLNMKKNKIELTFNSAVNRLLAEALNNSAVYEQGDSAQDFNRVKATLLHLGMREDEIDENEFNSTLRNRPFSEVLRAINLKKQKQPGIPVKSPIGATGALSPANTAAAGNIQQTQQSSQNQQGQSNRTH